MSDFILARKSRNIMSNMVHIFLNILLGFGSVFITILSGNPAIGILLVLLSKWRIFAVRWRFLWINIKSSLVDIIVGLSIVLLTYYSGAAILPVDFILAAFYTVWLIFIKPRTSEVANLIQSLCAVFLGISAAVFMTSDLNIVVLATLAFIIGYATSRHVLAQAKDKEYSLTTMVCGLLFAEIAWLFDSWSIIYTYSDLGMRIPQLAIILTIFTFTYDIVRQAIVTYGNDFRFKKVLTPIVYAFIVIAIIVVFFSEPIFNI